MEDQLLKAMKAEREALTNRAKARAILMSTNRGNDEAAIKKAVDAYDKARSEYLTAHNAVIAIRQNKMC